MLGGVGQKLSLNKNTESTEPTRVIVSDGTFVYPPIHPRRTYIIPEKTLLLDCESKEYFEFETTYHDQIDIEFFRLNAGSRSKIYIYRNTTQDLVISFDKLIYGPSQILRVKGGKSIYIIEVEAVRDPSIDLSVRYIVKIDGQRYQSSGVFHTTIEIPTLSDFGSLKKGTPVEQVLGLTINELIEKRLWQSSEKPFFKLPELALTGVSNSIVEEGSEVSFNIGSNFTQNYGGLSNGNARLYNNQQYISDLPFQYKLKIFGTNIIQSKQDYLAGTESIITEDQVVWENEITASYINSNTVKLEGKRATFFGALSEKPQNSEEIRSLQKVLINKSNKQITITSQHNKDKYFVYAYPSKFGKLSSINYIEGLNSDVLVTFTNYQLNVNDASLNNEMLYEVYVTDQILIYDQDVNYKFNF